MNDFRKTVITLNDGEEFLYPDSLAQGPFRPTDVHLDRKDLKTRFPFEVERN